MITVKKTMKMTMAIPRFRASIYFNFDLPWCQVEIRFDSYLREDRVSLPPRILLNAV